MHLISLVKVSSYIVIEILIQTYYYNMCFSFIVGRSFGMDSLSFGIDTVSTFESTISILQFMRN